MLKIFPLAQEKRVVLDSCSASVFPDRYTYERSAEASQLGTDEIDQLTENGGRSHWELGTM